MCNHSHMHGVGLQAFCIALGCLDFKHQERSGNGIGLDIWKGLAIPSSTPRSEKKEEPNNGVRDVTPHFPSVALRVVSIYEGVHITPVAL